jgi:hypothetical protein
MSHFQITVKIRVEVPDDGALGMNETEWANYIATEYASMAGKYKSIGAEESNVISVEKV